MLKNNIHSKILYLTIEITQLLKSYNCTYSEAERILELLDEIFKQQRENLEYDTLDNYFKGNKIKCANDIVIEQLNHVEDYC